MQKNRCPLEALIIRRLLIQAANFTEKQTVEPEPQPQPMPVDDGGPGYLGIIKIIFYIFIFAGLIGNTPSVRVTVDVNVREARQDIFPHFVMSFGGQFNHFEIHNG